MNNFESTLSFCITCKNRFKQIKKTLPHNLQDNRDHKHLIEFVLVDFGSTDGLQEWIYDNFREEMRCGYLKYYYTEEMKNWHSSIAKNTAHLLALNEIVTNLDCDNYTGLNGGKFVIDKMVEYGVRSTIFHQFSNNRGDGSYGRITLSKRNFICIGGYDESLEPMGYQDVDLIIRSMIAGFSYRHTDDTRFNRAIPNSKEEGLWNVETKSNWEQMNFRNYKRSRNNILSGNLIANQSKEHIGILDNIHVFEL
ncbi:MAG: glycosyltransferase [Porphyromonadaceae bacterium]|nr:glycosyltransferase [Porphyromonadaceae bacterium]